MSHELWWKNLPLTRGRNAIYDGRFDFMIPYGMYRFISFYFYKLVEPKVQINTIQSIVNKSIEIEKVIKITCRSYPNVW